MFSSTKIRTNMIILYLPKSKTQVYQFDKQRKTTSHLLLLLRHIANVSMQNEEEQGQGKIQKVFKSASKCQLLLL